MSNTHMLHTHRWTCVRGLGAHMRVPFRLALHSPSAGTATTSSLAVTAPAKTSSRLWGAAESLRGIYFGALTTGDCALLPAPMSTHLPSEQERPWSGMQSGMCSGAGEWVVKRAHRCAHCEMRAEMKKKRKENTAPEPIHPFWTRRKVNWRREPSVAL